MNGYTFRESNSVIFIFCLPSQFRFTFKENNLLLLKNFFPLRADLILEELKRPGKQVRSKNFSPFIKMARKHGGA